ncbi:Uncharacterised protein [Mycobacteroides abscessus subsp. abscessus]|nr:Uncharacterised protein [Mycobacteroides abscessus subsp. abscessus]
MAIYLAKDVQLTLYLIGARIPVLSFQPRRRDRSLQRLVERSGGLVGDLAEMITQLPLHQPEPVT